MIISSLEYDMLFVLFDVWRAACLLCLLFLNSSTREVVAIGIKVPTDTQHGPRYCIILISVIIIIRPCTTYRTSGRFFPQPAHISVVC